MVVADRGHEPVRLQPAADRGLALGRLRPVGAVRVDASVLALLSIGGGGVPDTDSVSHKAAL